MRRADNFGQNAVRLCPTFVAQPMLHESPNRFGLHVADISSVFGLWNDGGKKIGVRHTDPLFYSDQAG